MKTRKIIIGIVLFGGLLLFISCSNNTNVDKLLQNETTRKEVFDKISSNKDMMNGFMEAITNNDSSKMIAMNHKGMKGMKMGKDNMMKKMSDNPEMMKNMMKDKSMMVNMMKMMNEKGMMSKECMKSSMKMIGEKGKMMDNDRKKGKMINEEHKSHH